MAGHRIHQVHLASCRGQSPGVEAGAVADIEDPGGRRWEVVSQQVQGPDRLHSAVGALGETGGLVLDALVVLDELLGGPRAAHGARVGGVRS